MNFSTLISQDPQRYGLENSDATIIAQQYADYDASYQPVQTNATRTASAIAQKDATKASAIGSARVYARMIRANAGVTNQDKIDLGLHVPDPTRTPIPTPTTAPLLMIVSAFSGVHQLRFADENSPASRRKAPGASALQLNMVVAAGPVVNPDGSQFVGLFTKQPILVEQDPVNANKTATYFARWVTRTGKFGPWSLPQAMTIAFGGPVQAGMSIPDGGQPEAGDEGLKIAA